MYKIQCVYGTNGLPFWLTISAKSEVEAQTKVYGQHIGITILHTKKITSKYVYVVKDNWFGETLETFDNKKDAVYFAYHACHEHVGCCFIERVLVGE